MVDDDMIFGVRYEYLIKINIINGDEYEDIIKNKKSESNSLPSLSVFLNCLIGLSPSSGRGSISSPAIEKSC